MSAYDRPKVDFSTAGRIILSKEGHDGLKGPKRALKLLMRRN
jgi:hypothetical protein